MDAKQKLKARAAKILKNHEQRLKKIEKLRFVGELDSLEDEKMKPKGAQKKLAQKKLAQQKNHELVGTENKSDDRKVKNEECKSVVDRKVKNEEGKSVVDRKVKNEECKSVVDRKVKNKECKSVVANIVDIDNQSDSGNEDDMEREWDSEEESLTSESDEEEIESDSDESETGGVPAIRQRTYAEKYKEKLKFTCVYAVLGFLTRFFMATELRHHLGESAYILYGFVSSWHIVRHFLIMEKYDSEPPGTWGNLLLMTVVPPEHHFVAICVYNMITDMIAYTAVFTFFFVMSHAFFEYIDLQVIWQAFFG